MSVRSGTPPAGFEPLAVEVGELRGLLADIREFVTRFVVLPDDHAAVTIALWTAHTHTIQAAHATPYLLLTSPERESGKTLVLEVLELLAARPWRAASASEAAVFRKIAADAPTLLLDEIDAVFGSSTERTEGLRAILNAGNRAGACATRCVGKGSDQKAVDFEVYCAKALAGIESKRLPDTIRSRSVEIGMRRRKGTEPVEDFFPHLLDAEAGQVRDRLAAWSLGAVEALEAARPGFPDGLRNRARDAWWPLLAIADLASGEWPQSARAAALALSASAPEQAATHGARLLAKLRDALGTSGTVSTREFVDAINADDELPYGGWNAGAGIRAREVADKLRPYGVRPRTVRIDGVTAKGYRRDSDMEDAFERWLELAAAPDEPDVEPRPRETYEHWEARFDLGAGLTTGKDDG